MTRSLAALALAFALAACDSGSATGSPTDYECRSGATLTATVGSASYAAECVESNASSGGVTVRSYINPNTDRDGDKRSVEFMVESRAVGTYPVSGATFLSYASSPVVNGVPTTATLVASRSGQITVAESSTSRVTGTFSFSGREEITPPGGTSSPGATVTITGAFSVPL